MPTPNLKTLRRLSLAAALWLDVALSAAAADIRVIANPSVKASVVSSEELRGVFLETKTLLADGSRVEPVRLKAGAVHETFVKQVIGKSSAALEAYYRSLVFTGRGLMPVERETDAQVVDYVAKTKGAVGYVSTGADTSGVKTLEVR